MLQNTSLNAYYTEIKPTLGDRQKLIYEELLKHENLTNSELVAHLGIPINTVTPRVNELRKLGKVCEWGERECRITGRTVKAWATVKQTLF